MNPKQHIVSPAIQQSPQSIAFSHPQRLSNGPPKEESQWSGEESGDGEGEGEGDDDGSSSNKRKRPMSVSCELCKQRKVKCDRGQPSCGWCSRNGQLCEYKERKKPGLRAGYGRELEARLDRLEAVLRAHDTAINRLSGSNMSSPPTSAHNEYPSLRTPSTTQAQVSQPSRPEASMRLSRPPMYPPQTPTSEYGPPTGSSVHSMQTPSVYQSQIPQDGFQQGQLPGVAQMQHELYAHPNRPLQTASFNVTSAPVSTTVAQDELLPPYDFLYALTDLYFKHINTWCPILHRRSTLDSLFGTSALDEGDRILLHAIVATTLRFSTDPRLTEDSRVRYHDISKQQVLLYGLENSSVKALQALVILALDIVGTSNGPPGWNLLALITRSTVQLGLSVEATSASVAPKTPSIYTLRAMVLPEPRNWIEDESRRRLFWMVYVLDRYATLGTAFEFALDEREIDRMLPCRDDLFARNQPVETRWFRTAERSDYSVDRPENLGSFSYYVEIVGILSRIHQFLKRPVDIGAVSDVEHWQSEYRALDSILTSWHFSLPSEYGNMARLFSSNTGNKIVNCGWIMLHAQFHTTVIRLHSSAAYPTTRSSIFTPSYSAAQRCLNAVENISALCEYVRANAMLTKLGPPFAFCVWVASRLLLVHGSTIEHQVNPAIYFFVSILQEMGSYWNVAGRYASILGRVLDEYKESEQAPVGANGERATPSTVKILADMRRTAYDLDFLISRQPRAQVAVARLASVTPARTPAPNELEYLDVFDFFNVPRLPVHNYGELQMGHNGNGSAENGISGAGLQLPDAAAMAGEFNITNFMVDASSDWFSKGQT